MQTKIIHTIIKYTATIALASITASAMSATVNPYNYSVFEKAINDAKWQRGSNSEKQCSGSSCESTMNSSSNKKYIWANSSNGQLHFSTNGSQNAKWRSELRFEDSFSRGSTRTFTARIGYWHKYSTSKGFTVAQLHMESDSNYTVKGPPARLEIIDEDTYEVQWRNSYSCTSNCWSGAKPFRINYQAVVKTGHLMADTIGKLVFIYKIKGQHTQATKTFTGRPLKYIRVFHIERS